MIHALTGALAAFRRAPLLVGMSALAVGLSLFVVGLFALTAYNIQSALRRIEDRVEVVAYLHEGTTLDQVRAAERELRTLPEVLELRYVSKTEALATAVAELPEFRDAFSELDVNPLPASIEVRLRPGYREPDAVERLAAQLRAYTFVEEARYGREWVDRIMALQRIAAGATLMIGGAFAAVAAVIIGTAIRIAVAARREEIEIMRLVGATDGFIRRPFLIEGLLAGLIGGVAAALLTYGAHLFVGRTSMRLEWLPGEWLIATILAGAAYGLLAAAIAVRRHLRLT